MAEQRGWAVDGEREDVGGALTLRGHRSLPHVADLRLEAWAPTKAECMSEAVRALAESVARAGEGRPTRSVSFEVAPGDEAGQLREVLDEVVFLLDAHGLLPVAAAAAETPGGGLLVSLAVCPVAELEVVGPAPKAVTSHRLQVEHHEAGWRCQVVVDV